MSRLVLSCARTSAGIASQPSSASELFIAPPCYPRQDGSHALVPHSDLPAAANIQLLFPAKPICRSALTVGLLTAPQYNSAKLKSGKASMLRLSFPCDSLRNLQVGDLVQRRGQIIRARVERTRPAAECVDQG